MRFVNTPCNLGIILKKPDQHTAVCTALAFPMVLLCLCPCYYLKTRIWYPFSFFPILTVHKVFIWWKDDLFLPRIPLTENFIDHGYNQTAAVIDQCTEYVIIRCIDKSHSMYHWECQSSADSSMLVRFFEYDTQIALDEGEIKKDVLTVTLPNSAVLFLRCDDATPDRMKIEIITPGGTVSFIRHIHNSTFCILTDLPGI